MADWRKRFDTIVTRLRENSHKVTPQRLAIIEVLAKSVGHPSVEDIYEQLQDRFPTMSLATVYRNVLLIKSMGELLELGFADGSNRYDGNKPKPHPHVICTRCHRIIDPELSGVMDMTQEVSKETGFRIETHRIDFFGLCPDCQKKQ